MSVDELRVRLASNLQRAEGLTALSDWIEFPARNDLLRASVVMLHATLEDVLRSVLALRLPNASSEHLAMLKFTVGGRSKDNLTMSELANNVEDIMHALERASIPTNLLDPHKDMLAALMQRRHWIVHRADHFSGEDALEGPQTRPIDVMTVDAWRKSVRLFVLKSWLGWNSHDRARTRGCAAQPSSG